MEQREDIIFQLLVLNSKIDKLTSVTEDMRDSILRHRDLIEGNGREGLIVRVDRLEQRAKYAWWAVGLAITAAFSGLGEAIHRLWEHGT